MDGVCLGVTCTVYRSLVIISRVIINSQTTLNDARSESVIAHQSGPQAGSLFEFCLVNNINRYRLLLHTCVYTANDVPAWPHSLLIALSLLG